MSSSSYHLKRYLGRSLLRTLHPLRRTHHRQASDWTWLDLLRILASFITKDVMGFFEVGTESSSMEALDRMVGLVVYLLAA